ncbi:MAG: ABC transporter ATP-binding protein [Candidatus Aminicenantes bacterium]|jgi:ABC-2 type transport system ATP-binding protein
MTNVLKIQNLRKEYEEFVLDDISWDVPQGYITGLIGPNGAGKTTTIKLIMNLIKSDGGEVKVLGLDHIDKDLEIKNRVGYVGEEQFFYEHRSANWTGKFVSHFFTAWDRKRYQELLEEFEIPRKKMIRKFSKGMRVKLSLAIALSHNPDLIILDEPTAGLDPIIRRDVLDFLQSITQNGDKSVLISSHITDDIARIADTITYMINGRIALTAAKDDLLANWKRIHYSKGALDPKMIENLEQVEDHAFGGSGITRNYLEIKDSLSQGLTSGNIKTENVGLDDILISLVKGQ